MVAEGFDGLDNSQLVPGQVDKKPFYDPWIGKDYAQLLQDADSLRRWHVMGESHYSDDYDHHSGLTSEIVEQWAYEPSPGRRFFTRALQVVLNETAENVDPREAWSQLAFSNFAQQLLTKARMSPTPEMWEEGRRAFFGQLALTKPTVLIVLGKGLWQQLPDKVGFKLPPFQYHTHWPVVDDAWFYPYRVDGKTEITLALSVIHPSGRGFDWQVAGQRVRTAMLCYSNMIEALRDSLTPAQRSKLWDSDAG